MKNILFLFVFACFSLFFARRSDAQCYVRLEDASGFNTDAYQDTLQAAAAKLCAIFDSTGFAGQFKVYDFGFYLHQENTTGGYPEPFAQKMTEVQDSSPYYLLFGKQTDKSGVYTKFWVKLQIPDSAHFGCMTQLQREVYSERVEKKILDKYADNNNDPYYYAKAEQVGIFELSKILKEIKDCCLFRNGSRVVGCDNCSNEVTNTYFELNNYQSINLESIKFTPANIKNDYILDLAYCKIKLHNNYDYLGNHLQEVVSDIGSQISFNLIFTSNETFCSFDLDSLLNYSNHKSFTCWINYALLDNEYNKYSIKVYCNEGTGLDERLTTLIINNLYCTIYSALNIQSDNCGMEEEYGSISFSSAFADYTTCGPVVKNITKRCSSFEKFLKISENQEDFNIFVYTFNSQSIRFNLLAQDPREMMDASSVKGRVDLFYSLQSLQSGQNGDFVLSGINNDDALKIFSKGRPVIFVGIANQLLMPAKNLFPGQSIQHIEDYKIFDLAYFEASSTLLHEFLAHVENILNKINKGAIQEHEDYHGSATASSPSGSTIYKDPSKTSTRAYKVVKEIKNEMESKGYTIPNLN